MKNCKLLALSSALAFLIGASFSFVGISQMLENSTTSNAQTAQTQSIDSQSEEKSNGKMALGATLYAFGALNLVVAAGLNGLHECGLLMREEEDREDEAEQIAKSH